MKQLKHAISALALSATLALACAPVALAADSSATFKDHAEVFVFANGSAYTETDLFDNFKGVMPGDNLRQTVVVANQDPDGLPAKIYLRAEAHDEAGNPLSPSVAQAETVASAADFLAQMTMTVRNGNEIIFQGAPHVEGGLSENVLLGEFAQGETRTLTVELNVPLEMGNEYMNRVGEVDWIFSVEELDPVIPEEPEGPEAPGTPDAPGNPDGGFATTGDMMGTLAAAAAGVAALVGAVLLLARKMRKSE